VTQVSLRRLGAYERFRLESRESGVLVVTMSQAPELNAMDQLWRELKRLVAANRQAETIDALAADAAAWTLGLSARAARTKAGLLSPRFWLADAMQDFWLPT